MEIGRILIYISLILFVFGLILTFLDKTPNFYKNPLDFYIKKENFTFYFPLGTSILLSIFISIILHLIRIFNK